MIIPTPEFITAKFFMKDETPDIIDTLPHVRPSQVHGKNILVIDSETLPKNSLPSRPEADGILLTVPNDCAPVMIWGKSWVMILHSGYKGTVLKISREGLRIAREIYGDVGDSCAWIGPCIGRGYFRKYGDEWTSRGIEAFHRENYDVEGEKVYFDLAGEIRCQLLDEGLSDGNITLSGIDTLKDERCYSYRRGDIHERMTLLVSMKKGNA